ncbi:MAG: VTT domain-containing protein [Caldilineaceae bacterium]
MEIIIEFVRETWSTIHHGAWPELGMWSYILLALLVATEGPVSTLLGAAAAAAGILDIRFVFVSAFVGNVAGDCLWYSVGYVNNLQSIYRRGRWLGLQRHHLDRLELEMHTHATKLIALSKLAIGLIIPTLIAAGLAKVPWKRWFPLVLGVEVIWTIFIVNLGYHSAGLITQLERNIQLVGIVALVAMITGIIWYARRVYRQNEEAFAAEQSQSQSLASTPSQCEQTLSNSANGRIGNGYVNGHHGAHSSFPALYRKELPKQQNHKANFALEEAV